MEFNQFAWGLVAGIAAGPFVWAGLRWCRDKFTGLTS
tara:strand:- start:778 stop:888 length:111 start_codon:yes stop_codon:yes gene_type:complete